MLDRNYIREVVKQVINETVTFSERVQPDNDRFVTGDAIERKIWYVYNKLNTNGAMFRSPLVTTFPREEKDEYMCNIRFTSDKVMVDEAYVRDFTNKFLDELKSQFQYDILRKPFVKDKEFERELAGTKGMVKLKTVNYPRLKSWASVSPDPSL